MWVRDQKSDKDTQYVPVESAPLKDAVRQARVDSAERSGVMSDLRDAESVRLEMLNEALNPVFTELPDDVELFDRGITGGDTPRLWIDAVSHIVMGRDKRQFRFLQDGRYGRKILAETSDLQEIVQAVTRYVANRLVERERAISDKLAPMPGETYEDLKAIRTRRRWSLLRMFILGLIIGSFALFCALWLAARKLS
jgi:hypothetical protein